MKRQALLFVITLRQEMQFNQYSTVTVISVTNYLQKRALLLKTLHGRG